MTRPFFVAFITLLLLAGCGFQPRGVVKLPEQFEAVAVRNLIVTSIDGGATMAGNSADLVRQLKEALRVAGIKVSDEADLTIELVGEQFSRRTAALDARARAAEYEVTYEINYRIVAGDGSKVVGEGRLQTDRSYAFNRDAVLGAGEEEAQLRRDMRRDLVNRLLRQLQVRLAKLPAEEAAAEAEGKHRQAKDAASAAPAPAPAASTAPAVDAPQR